MTQQCTQITIQAQYSNCNIELNYHMEIIPITNACRLTVMTLGNPNYQERMCGISVFSEPSNTGVWWSVTVLQLMHNKHREPRAGSKKRSERDWQVWDAESIYLTSWNCNPGLSHHPRRLNNAYPVLRDTQNCNHIQILHCLFSCISTVV